MGPEWVTLAIAAVYVAVVATYISLVVNVGKIRRMLASVGFDEDRTCAECCLPVPAQARVCGHCGRVLVTVRRRFSSTFSSYENRLCLARTRP